VKNKEEILFDVCILPLLKEILKELEKRLLQLKI